MSGIYLGINTQNPVIGITSTNPASVQNMIDAQKTAAAQPAVNQQPPQQPPTVIHEMPWHKAHPGLKNIK